mmetsp:Transcript_24776/g.65033  ORF Transcript_24776/g.65033 Transcript_24776/m.65033 type:complete len:128 (+) Transcript_24776:146-529(+)
MRCGSCARNSKKNVPDPRASEQRAVPRFVLGNSGRCRALCCACSDPAPRVSFRASSCGRPGINCEANLWTWNLELADGCLQLGRGVAFFWGLAKRHAQMQLLPFMFGEPWALQCWSCLCGLPKAPIF